MTGFSFCVNYGGCPICLAQLRDDYEAAAARRAEVEAEVEAAAAEVEDAP